MLNFKVKQLQTWGLGRVSYKPERMATHESGKEEIEGLPFVGFQLINVEVVIDLFAIWVSTHFSLSILAALVVAICGI